MNTSPLYFSIEDYTKLSLLATATSRPGTPSQLRSELSRGVVVDATALPPTAIRLGSTVEIEDLESGEIETYTLVLPEQANVDARKLSVLAPIGTAVIGCLQGAEVAWSTPGGTRRLRIGRVSPPAEPATPVGLTLPLALPSAS
ncbi:GreA/GreB family elongation factor [Opitutus terrae]|uniref:GreA/GreB family elongation factor n=1 Tax=Opitutus terrae (strain DSM 11246 / JCM 15787 / PB90-1) TaxID=452637 RepID=B1ZU20_OPITP|nr:GreA/GreB family elongation factor [Opitutus terrae]ACB75902.1 GreA/GreB family elongation factor [Opitutus terrae PB90-1]